MTASKKSRRHPRQRPRDDTSFSWASAHVRLIGWQRPLAEWAAQHSNRKVAAVFGNKALDCVLNQSDFPPSPEAFCRRINAAAHALFLKQLNVGGSANVSSLRSAARTFFEWYLQTYVSATDDHGRVWVSPEHLNPIWVTKNSATASESTRRAMPTRFLRELLEILTAEDWAWARAQADDHVEIVRDGEPRRVWCPVRASVLALKLLLPLRTFQVRFLESSEGDDVCWRGGRWEPNCGPCAPAPGVVRRRGFLHRIEDSETGSDGMGFYINTNKTADAHQRAGEKGYVIPWQNSQAIAVVEQLEAWQAVHNPIGAPSAWSSLHDSQVCRSAPRSGAACFLMRDPGGMYANEPISDARVRYLWNRLVAELERRMAKRGETMANGEPVVLTRRSKSGAVNSRYDLHTLRVSLITALAVDGGLPLHILSKCVAGHASIVMTLYYVKVSREMMNEQLDAATARVDARAQERFAQYLKSEMGDDIAVVSNDPAALAVAREGDTASWMTMDTGLCPVGATRCHDGGPSLGKGIHGPVPDGPRNCCRCRFHLTGPAFLSGLVAKFNATSLGRNAAARECETATNLLREIEDRRVDTECRGEAFDARAMNRARERLDRAETRLASLGASLCAIADLVVRVRKIVSKSPPGLQLVAIGDERDVRVAIETTSDIDLADRVCQVAHIHPSIEATEASMRRAQAIDRMALRHGHTPIMLQLSDAEALRAGNEMVQLMSAQLGRDNAMQLLGGGEHLVEGVADLIDGWVAGAAGRMSIPKGEPLDQLRIGHGG